MLVINGGKNWWRGLATAPGPVTQAARREVSRRHACGPAGCETGEPRCG